MQPHFCCQLSTCSRPRQRTHHLQYAALLCFIQTYFVSCLFFLIAIFFFAMLPRSMRDTTNLHTSLTALSARLSVSPPKLLCTLAQDRIASRLVHWHIFVCFIMYYLAHPPSVLSVFLCPFSDCVLVAVLFYPASVNFRYNFL